jgi:hypothetical protein
MTVMYLTLDVVGYMSPFLPPPIIICYGYSEYIYSRWMPVLFKSPWIR